MKYIDRDIIFTEIKDADLKEKFKQFLDNGGIPTTLTKAVLITAILGGILLASSVAPNIFQVLPKPKRKKYNNDRSYFKNGIYEAKRKGWLKLVKNINSRYIYRLSRQGEIAARKLAVEVTYIPRPNTWDKTWRLVIFDIPHNKKTARDALRYRLKELQFFPLQKSVWVHPWPCEKEILYITNLFNISKYVEILTVDTITNKHALTYFKSILSKNNN